MPALWGAPPCEQRATRQGQLNILGDIDEQKLTFQRAETLLNIEYNQLGKRWKVKDTFTATIGASCYTEYLYDDFNRFHQKRQLFNSTTILRSEDLDNWNYR